MLHLAGIPKARIGEHVGQRNLAVTANTYSHVLADEVELDYGGLLEPDVDDARRSESEYERESCIEVAQLGRAETADRVAESVRAHSGRLLDEHARR